MTARSIDERFPVPGQLEGLDYRHICEVDWTAPSNVTWMPGFDHFKYKFRTIAVSALVTLRVLVRATRIQNEGRNRPGILRAPTPVDQHDRLQTLIVGSDY